MDSARFVAVPLIASAVLLCHCSSSSSAAAGTAGTDGGGGGGGGGGNSVTGTIAGASIAVVDGVFTVATPTQSSGVTENSVDVMLTSYANACSVFGPGNDKASTTFAKISMRTKSAGGTPIAPGTFNVVSDSPATGSYAEVELKVLDATCNDTKAEATGGTVTLTSLTDTEVVGTFNVTSDNGSASGSFDVQLCAESSEGGAGACVP